MTAYVMNRYRQTGQAMAEYTVVLFFGVMVLATGNPSPVERLAAVIQDNWRGYSFALSLSDAPDGIPAGVNTAGLDYNYTGMLTSLSRYVGTDLKHCKEILEVSPEVLKNGPLGFGGKTAPIGRCDVVASDEGDLSSIGGGASVGTPTVGVGVGPPSVGVGITPPGIDPGVTTPGIDPEVSKPGGSVGVGTPGVSVTR